MRRYLMMSFKCSVCGTELELSMGKDGYNNESKRSDKSHITANSAYEVDSIVYVKPCSNCKQELDDIKKAIKLINNFSEDVKK